MKHGHGNSAKHHYSDDMGAMMRSSDFEIPEDDFGVDFDFDAASYKRNATSKFNKRAQGKKQKEKSRHQHESAMYGEW